MTSLRRKHSDNLPRAVAGKRQLISIVVPVYNEAANVPLLVKALTKQAKMLPYRFEFLLVDDGSRDNSAQVIQELAATTPQLHLVQLARNFGKEAAVSAGLDHARGAAAIIMDADMQMPPERIGEFLEKWEQGSEVVVGVFSERNMSKLRAFGARTFYRIMQRIGSTKITPNATDFRLLDRQVIDVFNSLTERNRITRGLIDWMGFQRDYIYFKQAPRANGEPTYSFKKLIQLAMNSFTAFSFVPLKAAGYVGAVILTLSIPLGIFLYIVRFVWHNPWNWSVTGTTLLAVLNLFLIGVVLSCLGMMALYIAQIHSEVVNRPLYIVRKQPEFSYVETDRDNEETVEEEGEAQLVVAASPGTNV